MYYKWDEYTDMVIPKQWQEAKQYQLIKIKVRKCLLFKLELHGVKIGGCGFAFPVESQQWFTVKSPANKREDWNVPVSGNCGWGV